METETKAARALTDEEIDVLYGKEHLGLVKHVMVEQHPALRLKRVSRA